ncbi:MAG TPA: hypothetical protein VNS62_06280 [Candidatus Udaeobacter sp.]|nr:hypothetical protein [Candidatus Udaeobacter sp.]
MENEPAPKERKNRSVKAIQTVGFNARLARMAQPLAQFAASFPATDLFPVVPLLLIKVGGGLGLRPSFFYY